MKKLFITAILVIALTSCGKDKKSIPMKNYEDISENSATCTIRESGMTYRIFFKSVGGIFVVNETLDSLKCVELKNKFK